MVGYFVGEVRARGVAEAACGARGGEGRVGYEDVARLLPHGEGAVGYVPGALEPGEGWWGDWGGGGGGFGGCGLAEGDGRGGGGGGHGGWAGGGGGGGGGESEVWWSRYVVLCVAVGARSKVERGSWVVTKGALSSCVLVWLL